LLLHCKVNCGRIYCTICHLTSNHYLAIFAKFQNYLAIQTICRSPCIYR